MKTLKKIAFAIGLALWGWLGVNGYAAAQEPPGTSCDPNQGGTCAVNLSCDTTDYECAKPLALAIDDNACNPANHGGDCASGHCFNTTDNDIYFHGNPVCCAGPSDVFLGLYIRACDENGDQIYEELAGPLAMDYNGYGYCGAPTGWLRFDGGIYCLDGLNYKLVDAGTSPLATHGLMKTNPGELDAGVVILEPLGFYGWAGAIAGGLGGLSSVLGPNYVCQMPWYNPDGGWTEADVGLGHSDLAECGESNGPSYVCCGDERAKAGWPSTSCESDSHGVNHCACLQDGEPCDVPRYLDEGSYVFPQPGATGECCSPGLSTVIYNPAVQGYDGGGTADSGDPDPVIVQGQGWCHATAAGLWIDGGFTRAPGYCNCLPTGVACSGPADCCAGNLCISGTCQAACTTNGAGCTVAAQCCGHVCSAGVCS